jgi:hypothetical protein
MCSDIDRNIDKYDVSHGLPQPFQASAGITNATTTYK